MKPGKRWRAVLGGRDIRFADVLPLAEAFGFVLKRVRGNRHVLVHPAAPDALNLQPGTDGKAKPYQLRQLVALVERYGLELEE